MSELADLLNKKIDDFTVSLKFRICKIVFEDERKWWMKLYGFTGVDPYQRVWRQIK